MNVAVGDRIVIDSEKAGEPPRSGVVLEVIEASYGTHYRVRWDNGRVSEIRPTAGTLHTVEAEKAARA